MTDKDSTADERECGADVAAYALGALAPEEAAAFVRHLDACTVCRDELASFQQVVNALPMTAPPHRASPRLRRRVLRAVASEPRGAGASGLSPRPRRMPGWLSSRPAVSLAAVLVLAVVVFAGVRLTSSTGDLTRVVPAQVTGRGTAELRITQGRGELVVNRLSPPPPGEIYEVWIKRAHGSPAPTSALFSVTAGGSANIGVPGNLNGVAVVMVTPEPAGGSRAPTHPAVIVARLA